MSDTPETDAARIQAESDCNILRPKGWSFARKLELERDQARKLANSAMLEVDQLRPRFAALKQAVASALHRESQIKTDLWAEKTEHRMTKTTLSALAAERNQLRRALEQVAEDCTAWLHSEIDEPSVEFIKAIRTYAHEQSQAPLDTANCQLPTPNSPE